MIRFDAIRLIGLTTIDFPIIGASAHEPFQITSANGLGPPEMEVLLTETESPGGTFVNRTAHGRQIILRAGLNPDYKTGQTVSDLRYKLYGLLSPRTDPKNQSVILQLLLDNVPQVEISGYVNRIEIVPFNKEPEVQLTMLCLGPYLDAPERTTIPDIPESSSWTIDNVGLAPTGISFEVEFIKETTSFTIEILNSGIMRFYSDFKVGDVLEVSTSQASRFVGLKRSGEYLKYMEVLAPDSDWLFLHGGVHTVQTSDPTYFKWLHFSYRIRHWGI